MKLYDIGGSGIWTRGRLNRKAYPHHTLNELEDRGITLVVSLTPEGEPILEGHQPGTRYAGIEYLHAPMRDVNDRDMTEEELEWALSASQRVAEHITAGLGDALVMCRAGRNRTGLVTSLALMRLETGWAGWEALDHFRTFRRGGCMIKADGSSPVPHKFETYLNSLPSLDGRSPAL